MGYHARGHSLSCGSKPFRKQRERPNIRRCSLRKATLLAEIYCRARCRCLLSEPAKLPTCDFVFSPYLQAASSTKCSFPNYLNMAKLISSLLFVFWIPFGVRAQLKEEKGVAQAVEALRRAMIDPDQGKLEALTADELSYGHSSGVVQSKVQFIESLMSGASDFVTMDLTDQTIVLKGKTAVVRHLLTAKTNDGGKPGAVKLLVLLVWVRDHHQWKLLARQAVRPPQ
jgi:Domain of unknown function (DUF4440)